MSIPVRRAYVTLASGVQVHYRTAGEGPPLILMHPSPQCSEAMLMAVQAFAPHCHCFAIDTPGYGLSDPMPEDMPDIEDYARVVADVADALGFDRFILYGAATGAQISIQVGKMFPDRVALLMLDSNGHVPEAERIAMMDGYFPDATPTRSGGHLMTHWDMARNLGTAFPWNSGLLDDTLNLATPPAEMLQPTLMRYLRAGAHYDRAYHIALGLEDVAHLDGLTVPTTMMRWAGSIVLGLADAMIAEGLPDNVHVLHGGPEMAERYGVQAEAVREAAESLPAAPPPPEAQDTGRRYFDSATGQLHAFTAAGAGDTPLILLHDAWSSSARMMNQHGGDRRIIAFDLPGHGASQPLLSTDAVTLDQLAASIAEALKAEGIQRVDIAGTGLGAAVGAALTTLLEVDNLRAIDPLPYAAEERAAFMAALPDLSPRLDGAHLMMAWSMVRESEYFWPWFDGKARRPVDADVAAEHLHARVLDLLSVGAAYRAVHELTLGIGWKPLLADARAEVEVVTTAVHPKPGRAQALG